MSAAELLPLFVFTFLFLGTVTGFILHYRFIRWLREHHPTTWAELGAPTLLGNTSWTNHSAIRKFLSTLSSSNCSDQEMIDRGRAVALFNKIYVPTCALVLIAMFYFLVRH
jgi:hypothetical protein